MQPYDSAGAGSRLGDRDHGQRARVRREGRVGRGGIQCSKDVALELEVLDRGLDRDVDLAAEPGEGLGLAEARESAVDPVVDRVGVEAQLRRAFCEPVADPFTTPLDGGLVDVVNDDLVAVLEGELGDPGTHRSRADHADDRQFAVGHVSDRLELLERLAAGAAVAE